MLRDEGEAYGRKVRDAAVDVTATRHEGIIHDFMMLNALRGTNAAHIANRSSNHLPQNGAHLARLAPGRQTAGLGYQHQADRERDTAEPPGNSPVDAGGPPGRVRLGVQRHRRLS